MGNVTVLAVPARTEATAGKTGVGGTTYLLASNYKGVCRHSLGDNAKVTALLVYGRSLTGDCKAKAVIYADDGGRPAALLGTSDEVTGIGTTPAWHTFTFSSPISLSAGTYWLGIINVDQWLYLYRDAGTLSQLTYNADTYADGPTDPFGIGIAYYNYSLSVYAVYAGANVKLPTVRISETIKAVVAQATAAAPIPSVHIHETILAVVAQAVAEALLAQVRLPGPRIVPGRGEASSDARPRAYAETEPALQASASGGAPLAPASAGTQPPPGAQAKEVHE